MKITAIMGSPRLGDSYKIVRMVEERLKRRGSVEFEYLFLKDYAIGMCKGCFLCVREGERNCPIKDDIPMILGGMKNSDGLIFASPVYALGITGLMKNFMDRLAYNAHRPSFWGKKAMAVVTSMGTGIPGTLEFIKTWSIWGMDFSAELGVNIHPTLKPTRQHADKLEKMLDNAADRFYKSLLNRSVYRPALMKAVQFQMLKRMSELDKDSFPADYSYYKEKRDYYYETHIGRVKNLLAGLFGSFVEKYMKKNYEISG